MPTLFDQPNTSYDNSGTLTDGATIAAAGFFLTNTDSGRIYGNGVTFTVGGSTLVNLLGGVIGTGNVVTTYVTGSSGDDTVINAGLINGSIALGDGADMFIDRSHGSGLIDLGTGNDIYRVESSAARFINAVGGGGQDRLIFSATGGQYWSGTTSGFEQLTFLNGGNFEGFSGYQSIDIAVPSSSNWSFVNLLNSLNPSASVTMTGGWLMLRSSSVNSVTGDSGSNFVNLGQGGIVANGISLGSGDDTVTLDSHLQAAAPSFTSAVDGGANSDTIMLQWAAAGDRSYDLSLAQGFEKLNVNQWYIVEASTARVSNASGFTDVDAGQNVTLILSLSSLTEARVGGGFGGGITLESGVIIDRYGFPEAGGWNSSVDIAQGNPLYSTQFLNAGTVENDIRLYIGDDLYDGRNGTLGGVVYGNAGNDTLIGGIGAERMQGGFGADILQGGGGSDTLTGGGGYDTFIDSKAGHNGDTITDFTRGDRIVFSDAALQTFSFTVSGDQLIYSGGSLTAIGLQGAALSISAAVEGGVQIIFRVPPLIFSAGPPVPAFGASQSASAGFEDPMTPKSALVAEDTSFEKVLRHSFAGTDIGMGHGHYAPSPADFLGIY